jgi:hypothetical protein
MHRYIVGLACLLALAACAAKQPAATQAAARSSASSAAAPLPSVESILPTWIEGAWQSADGDRETWVRASNVLWGIGFSDDGYEVMRIERDRAALRFTAWPDGDGGTTFVASASSEGSVRFENLHHDFPQVVSYTREGESLKALAVAGERRLEFAWTRVAALPAPALEQADLSFARDTAARGAEGWAAWFAPDGALWRQGRVQGPDAVLAAMTKTFGQDAFRLSWKPTASGLAKTDAQGFTVGTWSGQARRADGTFAPEGTGTYLTIWARQPDGAYRVLFDLGTQD